MSLRLLLTTTVLFSGALALAHPAAENHYADTGRRAALAQLQRRQDTVTCSGGGICDLGNVCCGVGCMFSSGTCCPGSDQYFCYLGETCQGPNDVGDVQCCSDGTCTPAKFVIYYENAGLNGSPTEVGGAAATTSLGGSGGGAAGSSTSTTSSASLVSSQQSQSSTTGASSAASTTTAPAANTTTAPAGSASGAGNTSPTPSPSASTTKSAAAPSGVSSGSMVVAIVAVGASSLFFALF